MTVEEVHRIFQYPQFLIKLEISFAAGLVHGEAMQFMKMKQVQIAWGAWEKQIAPEFDRLCDFKVFLNTVIEPNRVILQHLGWDGNEDECHTLMIDYVQAQKMQTRLYLQDYYEYPKCLAVLLACITDLVEFFVGPSELRARHWISGFNRSKERVVKTIKPPKKKLLSDSECKAIMRQHIKVYDDRIRSPRNDTSDLEIKDGLTRFLIGEPCQEEPDTLRALTLEYINSDDSTTLEDPKFSRLVIEYQIVFVAAPNHAQGVEGMHFTAQKGAKGGKNAKDDFMVHVNNIMKNKDHVNSTEFAAYFNSQKDRLGSKESIISDFELPSGAEREDVRSSESDHGALRESDHVERVTGGLHATNQSYVQIVADVAERNDELRNSTGIIKRALLEGIYIPHARPLRDVAHLETARLVLRRIFSKLVSPDAFDTGCTRYFYFPSVSASQLLRITPFPTAYAGREIFVCAAFEGMHQQAQQGHVLTQFTSCKLEPVKLDDLCETRHIIWNEDTDLDLSIISPTVKIVSVNSDGTTFRISSVSPLLKDINEILCITVDDVREYHSTRESKSFLRTVNIEEIIWRIVGKFAMDLYSLDVSTAIDFTSTNIPKDFSSGIDTNLVSLTNKYSKVYLLNILLEADIVASRKRKPKKKQAEPKVPAKRTLKSTVGHVGRSKSKSTVEQGTANPTVEHGTATTSSRLKSKKKQRSDDEEYIQASDGDDDDHEEYNSSGSEFDAPRARSGCIAATDVDDLVVLIDLNELFQDAVEYSEACQEDPQLQADDGVTNFGEWQVQVFNKNNEDVTLNLGTPDSDLHRVVIQPVVGHTTIDVCVGSAFLINMTERHVGPSISEQQVRQMLSTRQLIRVEAIKFYRVAQSGYFCVEFKEDAGRGSASTNVGQFSRGANDTGVFKISGQSAHACRRIYNVFRMLPSSLLS